MSTVNKLVLTLLVIPLLIVLAVRNPVGMGHLVQAVFTIGAKLLDGVATLLGNLLGTPAH